MNAPSKYMKTKPDTLIDRVERVLGDAGSDGLSMREIAGRIYKTCPVNYGPTIRTLIRRFNAEENGRRIACADGATKDAKWVLHGKKPSSAEVLSEVALFERHVPRPPKPVIDPSIAQAERIRARFAPGCFPRYGR